MKKSLFFAALALFALVACEPQQSELDLQVSTSQKATVNGQVTFSLAGVTTPADSVEVRALVDVGEFTNGVLTGEDKQFGPVRTDAKGFYSIQIPAGSKTLGSVRVQVVPFKRPYVDPNTDDTSIVFYTSAQEAVPALIAGDVERKDIQAKPQLEALSDYTGKVTISGTVSVDAGYRQVDGSWENTLIPYAEKVLKIQSTYGTATIDFDDVTTDAKGAFTFSIPAGANAETVTISTVRFEGNYTQGPDKDYKAIKVFYDVAQKAVAFSAANEEIRNINFSVTAYDPMEGEDLSKNFEIKRIAAVVKTKGEVLDSESTAEEEVDKWKWDDVFLPFEATVTISCPNFDSDPANAQSALLGKKLVYNVTASTKDGAIVLENIKVFSAWNNKNYNLRVTVEVADKIEPLTHTYYEFQDFKNAIFGTQTWAEWHQDNTLSEPLKPSFWSRCWPSTKKQQQIEGYYQLASSVSRNIDNATLKYYGEYEFPSDIVVPFNVRDTEAKKLMGIWENPNYNTRNDKDKDGNYTPFAVTDDAKDSDGVKLNTLTYSSKILQHDKYQGVCRSYWQGQYGGLW